MHGFSQSPPQFWVPSSQARGSRPGGYPMEPSPMQSSQTVSTYHMSNMLYRYINTHIFMGGYRERCEVDGLMIYRGSFPIDDCFVICRMGNRSAEWCDCSG